MVNVPPAESTVKGWHRNTGHASHRHASFRWRTGHNLARKGGEIWTRSNRHSALPGRRCRDANSSAARQMRAGGRAGRFPVPGYSAPSRRFVGCFSRITAARLCAKSEKKRPADKGLFSRSRRPREPRFRVERVGNNEGRPCAGAYSCGLSIWSVGQCQNGRPKTVQTLSKVGA